MDIVHERSSLERYMREASKVTFDSPVLSTDSWMTQSKWILMLVSDGNEVKRIGGVSQHIEQAGVHSGDSACSPLRIL